MLKNLTLVAGLISLVMSQVVYGAPWALTTPDPATAPNTFYIHSAVPYEGTGPDSQFIRIKIEHNQIVQVFTEETIAMGGGFGPGSLGGEFSFTGTFYLQVFEVDGETEIQRISQTNLMDDDM